MLSERMAFRSAGGCERGFTLLELLIAGGLATLLLAGLMSLDAVRIRVTANLKSRMSILNPSNGGEQIKAAQAAVHITRTLEMGDRFRIQGGATPGYWFRVPVGCIGQPPGSNCYTQTASYEWRSYRVNTATNQLRYMVATFDGTIVPPASQWRCTAWAALANNIRNPNRLTFTQRNEDSTVGGDGNVIEFGLHWRNGQDRYFRGEVTFRQTGDWTNSFVYGLPADQLIGIDQSTVGNPRLRGVPLCLN